MSRSVTPATAVVPLRGGAAGKSRLAGVLAAADRAALVVALARHVVATLAATDGVAEVLVVAADAGFARSALAGVAGPVRVVPQPAGRRGLNVAVDVGREVVAARAAAPGPAASVSRARLLVVHADLPALTGDDVAALLAPSGPLTLATDRLGSGTNALVLDPATAPFAFRFGAGSLAAHRVEAAAHGWDPVVVRRPGTAVDLDTPQDWAAVPGTVRRRLIADVPALQALERASGSVGAAEVSAEELAVGSAEESAASSAGSSRSGLPPVRSAARSTAR